MIVGNEKAKVTKMGWEGKDFVLEHEDGSTTRLENAFMSKVCYEMDGPPGCGEIPYHMHIVVRGGDVNTVAITQIPQSRRERRETILLGADKESVSESGALTNFSAPSRTGRESV